MANPNDYFDALPDPTVGAKLKAAAELRDARDAFDAAEKAMHAAGLRLWGARRAAKDAGVDLGQAWGAEPGEVKP